MHSEKLSRNFHLDLRIYFVIFTLHFSRVHATSLGGISLLKKGLLKDYDSSVRGKYNQSQPTNLEVMFYIYNLNRFDELNEVFSISGILYITWTDERMTWNPEEHNDTVMVSFLQNQVWTPNIVLANTNDDNGVLRLGNDWMYVRYMHNGTAIWSPITQFNSYCMPDVIKFPYDIQECSLHFVAWTHEPHEVVFKYLSTKVNMDFYHSNGVWIIKDGSVYSWVSSIQGERREVLIVTFVLQRRANFFLLNLILPLSVMNVLNILVFLLPPTSGERVGYAITVLLAICVYMTIVSDNIPKSSNPGVSYLCTKCLVDMIISSFVVLFTIIGLRFYRSADDVVASKQISILTKCILGLHCKKKSKVGNSVLVPEYESSANEKPSSKDARMEEKELIWRDVGKASDGVFFVVCLIAFVMSDIVFFAYVQ